MTQAFDPSRRSAGRVDVRVICGIPGRSVIAQGFQQTAAFFLLAGSVIQPLSNGIVGDCA